MIVHDQVCLLCCVHSIKAEREQVMIVNEGEGTVGCEGIVSSSVGRVASALG